MTPKDFWLICSRRLIELDRAGTLQRANPVTGHTELTLGHYRMIYGCNHKVDDCWLMQAFRVYLDEETQIAVYNDARYDDSFHWIEEPTDLVKMKLRLMF